MCFFFSFPTTLSIPSHDMGKYVGLRNYQQLLVQAHLCCECNITIHCFTVLNFGLAKLFVPAPWRMLDSFIRNVYVEITCCRQTSQHLVRVAINWWWEWVSRKEILLHFWFITSGVSVDRWASCSYKFAVSRFIQGVPGGKDLTSGECSLGQTIPI